MQIHEGWFSGAERLSSPNCDARPDLTPSLIVVHCISLPAGHYGNDYVPQFFLNQLDCDAHPDFDDIREVCVSSHLFIRRDGTVIQFVPLHERAWHAGESSFKGRPQCNDFSIGVELEGIDTGAYTQQQYEVLANCCAAMMQLWQIPLENIVGHSDIAPGRKTDPGPGFDWHRLHQLLNSTTLTPER